MALLDIGHPQRKANVINALPTCTKTHLTIWRGHSGAGMMEAAMLANEGWCDAITTVSRRGKPDAPYALQQAFISTMSERCTHYMAQCDERDRKAVECLMDWAPAYPVEEVPANYDEGLPPSSILSRIREEMAGSMTAVQLKLRIAELEELKAQIFLDKREIKKQLHNKKNTSLKGSLQEQLMDLEEQETTTLEFLAELTSRKSTQSVGGN